MPERKSLPLEQFPRKFQLAVKRFKEPRRGRRRYSKASIRNTIVSFGQYLAVVQKAGLPLELSRDGLSAFIDDLDARKLRNSTRLTYLSGVQAIATEVKYSKAERRLILEDCEIYRAAMMREVPTKVRKMAARPITLRDVAMAGVKWRQKAGQADTMNRRRTYFQRSAVLAFLSMVPLRISDVTGLIVGEQIQRRESGWFLNLTSGKSDYRHNGPLHHNLTPYLDDLLLYGDSGSVHLRYAGRIGTPLFGTEMNRHLSSRTLAYNFKVATGHAPHIVRTLVHDAMAKHGAYGAELARILCGQTSIQIAKSYEVHAQRFRAERAQEILRNIQARTLPKRPQRQQPDLGITDRAASIFRNCISQAG